MKNLHHRFRGKQYSVKTVPRLKVDGDCDSPKGTRKEIRLQAGLPPLRDMEVAIHEALHACFWDMDEDVITQSATDLGRFLWRLGYRKIKSMDVRTKK